jgi:carbamoyl-phosphate synthase small subunit
VSRKIATNKQLKSNRSRSGSGSFFINQPSKLYLSDGAVFEGRAPAWQSGSYAGEVVFNTGMTGYIESLTDPSYAGQILVFTYPLIGNYGVQPAVGESAKIQVNGVIVTEAALKWSHSGSEISLLEWLKSQNVPILSGVDTRALTKHLRTRGSMIGAISSEPVKLDNLELDFSAPTIDKPIIYNEGKARKVILVDCGAKDNILRSLLKLPVQVKKVPADYDYTNEDYDGVLLSNGPGDPEDYKKTIEVARKALKKGRPVFGICLGSQIMALAAGAKTYKLVFGHRGHNQPCIESGSNRCYITSQNHGYAVDEKSLPADWRVNYRNLNDNSVEGIEHKTKPFFSVQFHPEACPGPTDTSWLFERFYQTV